MEKKLYWQKIIDDQKRSGLSAKRYCDERNINLHTFFYWKSKFAAPPLKLTSTFLPVKVREKQEGFTVKFAAGQMTFLVEPNPTWFAKVLKEMNHEESR